MEPHLKRWSTMVPWTQAREKDENSALYRGRNSRPGSAPEEWWRIVSFSQFCPLRGGWTLLRMAQLTPSIAANSNKQDFFFLHGEVIQEMKGPRSGGYIWEAGGLKTSVSVPVHLCSAGVGQSCRHVVAVCRHSSASLGAAALSSLHSSSCLFFLWTDTQSDDVGSPK